MKYIHILILIIPMLVFGQEPTTITVTGRSLHYDKTPIFKGDVTLGATFSSYPETAISFEQMRSKYNEALKANGLELKDMTEDALGYALLRYNREGMIYRYETTSIKEFQAFMTATSFGVNNLNYGYEFIIDAQEAALLISKALQNASAQAQLIAAKMGKKIKGVVAIEDRNVIDKVIKKSMYYDHKIGEYFYEITVVFALENE